MVELTNTEILKTHADKSAHLANAGLEDVIAGDSSICFIDGPRTRLVYRGYSINDLAMHSTFEEVAYLLYYKKLPNKSELKNFCEKLSGERKCPEKFLERMNSIPKKVHPMTVLRTMVSACSFFDDDPADMSYESNLKKAVRLTAQMPAIVAAWDRVRNGEKIIEPRNDLNHAENFLYMLSGKQPDPVLSKALDLYLVLLVDHELNASTFACRVTASTLSDYYSAITSAIGALKGPLHGGANEQVIKMISEIGEISNVDNYVQDALSGKKKIMGFGHRVYKIQDPRSPLLKEMSKKVCSKTGNEKLYRISERIEELVSPAKKLPSNVDFFSATVLYCVGIPIDLFTPIFAMSRIAGWSAHYLEQIADNRILRPRAEYTGPMDLPYIPIDKR